jgi:hypothetical protein
MAAIQEELFHVGEQTVIDVDGTLVIIDDKSEVITSVQTEMEKHRILCRGYLYQGVQRHPMHAFNRKIAEVQLDYLIHRNQLLTATQVATMIAVT